MPKLGVRLIHESFYDTCSSLKCSLIWLFSSGIALKFVTKVFQTMVNEKDFACLSSALRKAELENRLLVNSCQYLYNAQIKL